MRNTPNLIHMPKRHNRRSIRLRGFDYASPGAYFVTLNTKNRIPIFGTLRDGVMHLNDIGRIVHEEWVRSSDIRPEVVLDEFVIMPNHMHMIVWIRDVDGIRARPLGNIIGGFKSSVSRRIQDEINHGSTRPSESIWQRNYHEIIVRDERALRNFRDYIIENPIKG
jgi:REP element-mobilizing transposase RayT